MAAAQPAPGPDYSAFSKKLDPDAQVLHALNRLTFGPRAGDAEAVKSLGLNNWIELQLHPERIAESTELDQHLAALPTVNLTQSEIAARYVPPPRALAAAAQARQKGEASPQLKQVRQSRQTLLSDLVQSKLYRAIYSNRQLEAVLDDFWFNHFNVDVNKGADHYLVTSYERDAIRPHVLGRFRDLLEATATSPAMMFYLDNWQSVAPGSDAAAQRFAGPRARLVRPQQNKKRASRGLNENYARELMELHTLGVDGGYTQKDVTEVARCFTGWTIERPNLGGPFIYNDRTHDKGEKIVLGVKIPAGGGREDGEKVLDILAAHPSTARHISRELAQRFVADDPPPALVERMAQTFQSSQGDVRAVLETMFRSPEFFSQGAYRAKIKSPLEMAVSAARAAGVEVDAAMPLANQIAALGEPLYRKLEPTGYSNLNEEWVSSSALLARMNLALQLAQDRLPGSQIDPGKFPVDPSDAARKLLFAEASPQTLEAIGKALEDQKQENPDQPVSGGLIAGLVLGSPDFQRR
jgi:uncharacterized protein (DUF1800 family)